MRWIFELESGVFGRVIRAFRPRRAQPASVAFNTFKTLVQSLGMWLVFLGIGPLSAWSIETILLRHGWPLARFGFPRWGALGLFGTGWLVAWASAWALIRWGDGTPLPLDATNKLVVRGPYRWIRNPMAFSSLLQGAAIGLGLGSPLILLYVLAGAGVWNWTARPWEERDLEEQFGDEYRAYGRNVRCWIPRTRPYSPPFDVKGNNVESPPG